MFKAGRVKKFKHTVQCERPIKERCMHC